jgi:hypothetical protein
VDIITNKRASVSLYQSRMGIAECLDVANAASRTLPQSSSRGMSEAAASGVAAAVAKEAHEATRERTLLALGGWLARLGGMSDDVKGVIAKGLAQPAKGIAEQYVACLARACESLDFRLHVRDLVPALVGLVKASTPTQVGVAAVCVCVCVCVCVRVCVVCVCVCVCESVRLYR